MDDEILLNDEYETFSDSDFEEISDSEEDEKSKRKIKFHINRNTVSIVMMGIVIVFSVANLVLGVMNYNRYNELQSGVQFYFPDNNANSASITGIITEKSSDFVFINTEPTTVFHVEISTNAPSTQSGNTVVAADTTVVQTSATQSVSGVVNINTATVEELTALNGVGEKKAQAIVDYRNGNGYFTSVEELTNVSGIGEKTLEKNIDIITVG